MSRAHLIGNRRSSLWRTAVHEAGHAVVCLAAGGTFRAASVRASDGGRTAGYVDGTRGLSPMDKAVSDAAGGFAETALLPTASSQRRGMGIADLGGCGSDFASMLQLAERGVDLEEAMTTAGHVTSALGPLIEVAAAALIAPKPLRALRVEEVEAALHADAGAWAAVTERVLGGSAEGVVYPAWLLSWLRSGL